MSKIDRMTPEATTISPTKVTDIISETMKIKLNTLKLPNEMLIKIMSYLRNEDIFGNFALASKHFNALTLDPCAVKYLNLEDFEDQAKSVANYQKWMVVIKRSRTLIELKIKDKYNILEWNDLIKETLKSNPCLKSLKIDYQVAVDRLLPDLELDPEVTEALKHTKNLQHFESNYVVLNQNLLETLCQFKTLKRVIVHHSNVTEEFVVSLAHSNNPIEYFFAWVEGDVKTMIRAYNVLFEMKKYTIKKVHFPIYGTHEKIRGLPVFSQCKNLEEFVGQLFLHDLALVSNLPKLKKLTIIPQFDDVYEYFKQFRYMNNIHNLEFFSLELIYTTKYDSIVKELSKIPFPNLKRLSVTCHKNNPLLCESLTEKTLKNLVKNIPTLETIQLDANFVSKISHIFVLKMFKETFLIKKGRVLVIHIV